jgi:dephospho-CoA kinase
MTAFPDKIVVGVTGGIACGKSTVCTIFETLGWDSISADSCAHFILKEDRDVIEQVEARFGNQLIDTNGSIDKTELARLIFESSDDRLWLENLLHPKIRLRWMNFVENSKKTKIVVEIPLLFENNLNSLFTKTISVYASKSIQRSRLLDRGISKSSIESRMEIQMKVTEKADRADFVILTDGKLDTTTFQINHFLTLIT